MSYILEDRNDYEIYFSHQCDARVFSRGSVKNIGFLAIKSKYPDHYKDITFVINDVDVIPFNKIFDYHTTEGVVKHYYGFKYALGGLVVMKGSDFEKVNGFPCYWGWGMEDNALQKRCERAGLVIDRSVFYKIGSPEILQLFDGISRIISKKDPWRGEYDNGVDGLSTITQLQFTIDDKSDNPTDNIFVVHNPRIFVINIKTFLTLIPFGSEEYYNYDLREPKRKIIHPDKIRETHKSVVHTKDWSNIPHYPTTQEKLENMASYLVQMGKVVPPEIVRRIEEGRRKEIEEDAYNKSQFQPQTQNQRPMNQPPQYQHQQHPIQRPMNQPQYRQQQPIQRPMNQPQYHQQHPIQRQLPPPPNKYSPYYAAYVGAKPRAQTSANVGLGGIKK